MMNNDFKVTVITEDSDFLTAVQNATKGNVVQEHSHEKSKLRDYRQKIVIIDYDSVPLSQETLKEWSENTQFLILVLKNPHNDIIQDFQDYISDVWYKSINSVILEQRLSTLRKLYSIKYLEHITFEFRVPLTAISGYSEILLGITPLTEEQHEFVSVIKNNTIEMSHLINNSSTYFKILNEKINLNFEVVSINTILNKIREKKTFVSLESRKSLFQFELYQEDNLPAIYADEYRVIQIIEMILRGGNIDGSTKIKFTISQIDTYINFAINSEKEFVRSHENEYHFLGIPFGETIIPHIVEAHKGTIQIDTSSETGSTFSFTIPIAQY